MSTQTVVDVVISGSTTTVVDKRIDGVTTVAGAPPVTNVSGQIPDLGVDTDILATEGDILSLTNDVANLRANLIVTGTTLTDEIGVLSGHLVSTGNNLEFQISTLSGNLIASGNNLDSLRDVLSGNLITTGQDLLNRITNSNTDISSLQTATGLLSSATGALQENKFNKAGGTISGSIIPNASGTLNLGSESKPFLSGYFKDLTVSNNTLFIGDVPIHASNGGIDFRSATGTTEFKDVSIRNLTVTGTEVIIDVEHLGVKDNTIVINSGEQGAGITAGSGGIVIDRGTLPDADIIFNETNDNFEIDFPLSIEGSLAVKRSETGSFADDSDISSVTTNLIATGRNLQTQISNNDNDILTLTNNLNSTGQTLQVQIDSNDSDISTLTSNISTTGQTLQTQITSNDSDISSLTSNLVTTGQTLTTRLDQTVSNLATSGQILQTQITSNDSDIATLTSNLSNTGEALSGNLISTGNFLDAEIAIVSGLTTGVASDPALSGKVDDLSGNLITTGQTLTSEIAIVSGIATGRTDTSELSGKFNALSGNLITTGQTLTTDVNNVSSKADNISGNLIATGQTLQTQISSNDSDISTLTSNLSATGETLETDLGEAVSNLATTGQILQVQITSNDSDISSLTSNLITTGQTLTSEINTVSGLITDNDDDISDLKAATGALKTSTDNNASNLISSGNFLDSEIAIVSGIAGGQDVTALSGKVDTLSGNLITTGQTLQTQITSNDSDISSLTSNLITTGQTLTSEIAIVSGLTTGSSSDPALSGKVDTLSGNLITTGQTLQTQITSNDSDITNLTSNLVTTGQTLTTDITTVSGLIVDNDGDITALKTATGVLKTSTDSNAANLITTGQTLQTQITSNDGDISTLTTNLGTTGQTLQTQITSNDSDISTLTSNLITTGQTLTTDISTVSGLITDNDADITALKSATGVLKTSTDANTTNLITTGQTLQTQITSNDGDITTLTSNLVTTGQTLQTQITSNDSDISTLTTNVGTTGQTLQTQITSNDSDIASLTTNLGTTGQTLQTQITSNDSDISTLDSTTVKLTTNQSIAGNKIFTNDVTINNLTVTGTEVVVDVENLAVKDNIIEINSGESGAGISRISGGIVIDRGTATNANILYNDANDRFELNFPLAVEGEVVASASNLITTGQTLTTNINTVSTNLGTSGQTLQTQITSNDSDISTLTTNLGTTGQTLQTQITSNDSDISTLTTNLGTTGQTLQTQITSNDSDISTLTSNLVTTGQTLQTQITSNDSDISTLTTNLGTTGQTLQAQITSNDSDISTLTSNLVSTGSVVDDISGNLMTTGQTLQTQITSNDSDIITLTSNLVTTGQTLTTNINTVSTNLISTGKVVDDVSGNLITTGQTLQTQITSNDTDITNLSSNLVTTGQTLTTNINTVATNLVTTGQTLTSEIATVSGLIPATVIDGGGTANKVPLWSDANTIGDSVISQSSSRIGIGTNAPDQTLHVNSAGLNFVAKFESTDDKASILIEDDDTLNYIHSQNGYLSLGGQNSLSASNLNINSTNGSVGVGTITPNRALHVVPASNVPAIKVGHDGTQGNGSLIEFDNGYTQKFYVGMSDTYASRDFVIAEISTGASTDATNPKYVFNGNGDGSFYITDAADNDVKVLLNTNGDSYLNGGSVGIGTNAPTEPLHVESTAADILINSTTANQATRIRLKTTSHEYRIGTQGTVDNFWIYDASNSAYRMVISPAGAVGINTTSPNASSKLHVYGWTIIQSATNFASLRLQSTAGSWDIDNNNGTFGLQWAGGDKLTLSNSGNLTVGGSLSVSGGNVTINNSMAYRVGGDGTTLVGSLGNASGVLSLKSDGTRDVQVGSNSYPAAIFVEGSNGQVGIGTNNPSVKLHVEGTGDQLYLYGGANNNIRFYNGWLQEFSTTGGSGITSNIYYDGSYRYRQSDVGVHLHIGNGEFDFRTSASGTAGNVATRTQRMVIANNGNVGIGTNSPAHKFEVYGGGGGTFGAITNRQSANANTDGIATVNYNAGNSSLRLWVDASGNRKINAGGTEVISFTTTAVDIKQATTFSSGRATFSGTAGADGVVLAGGEDNNHSSRLFFDNGAAGEAVTILNVSAGMQFRTGGTPGSSSGTTRMYLNSAGNLGVGTGNPPHKLSIYGTGAGKATVQIEGEGGADPYINFLVNNTTHWAVGADDSASDSFKISQHSALGTNDRITVLSGGSVGIGTNAPATILEASGTIRSTAFLPKIQLKRTGNAVANGDIEWLGNDDSVDWSIRANYDSGGDNFNIREGTTSRLYIKSGFVGIGETNPDKPLHIKGTNTAGIVIENTTNATNMDIDWYNNVGSVAGRIRYSEGTGDFTFMPNQSTAAVMFKYDGKVGIGVADPDQSLEVAGAIKSAGAYGFYAGRQDGTWSSFGTGVPTILLRGTANNSRAGAIHFQEYDGNTTSAIYSTDGSDGYGFVMSAYQGDIKFATGSLAGTKMVILGNGNVGIGTNAPVTKLDIWGGTGTRPTDPFGGQNQLFISQGSTTNAGITISADNNGGTQICTFIQSNTSASAALIGTQSNHGARIRTNNTDRITIASGGAITFNSAFTFPTTDGSANQVLQTDGSGTVTWATVSGGGGGGGVSGSGTDHYIPRWNGTTALQDSAVIALDSGSVGIGVAAPDSTLHVAGDIKSKGDGKRILLESNDYLVAALTRQGTSGSAADQGGLEIYNAGTTKVALFANTTSYINNGANFGIGTNAPGVRFHLVGAAGTVNSLATSVSAATMRIQHNSASSLSIFSGNTASSETYFQAANYNGTTAYVIALNPYGGSVGIGTNAPADHLQVKGSGSQSLRLTSTSSHASIRVDRYNTSSDANFIIQTGGVNKWRLSTGLGGNDEKLTIYDDIADVNMMSFKTAVGVGVGPSFGTREPEAPLHILGGYDANNPKTLIIAGREDSSTVYGGIQFEQAGGNTFFGIGNDSRADRDEILIGGGFGSATNATALRVFTGAYDSSVGTERLTILSSGSVGIGTASPSETLEINHSNHEPVLIKSTGNYNSIITMDSNRSSANSYVGGLAGKWNGTQVASIHLRTGSDTTNKDDGYITLLTAPAGTVVERMRIQSDGNVGIGTNAPAGRLHVSDVADFYADVDGTDSAVVFKEGGGNSWRIGNRASGDKFNITQSATSLGTNVRFTIDDGGSVGIGTESPTELLEVDGNIRLGDGNHRNIIGPTNATLGIYSNPNDSNEGIKFSTDGGSTIEMFLQDGGNVGIGTEVPKEKLHISNGSSAGDGAVYPLRLSAGAQASTSGDATGIKFIQRDQYNDYGAYFRLANTASNPNYLNPRLEFGVQNTNTNVFGSVSTKMVITGGGSVGIGTNAPVNLLHISGADESTLMLQANTGSTGDKCHIGFGCSTVMLSGTNMGAKITFERLGASTGGDLSFHTRPVGGTLTQRFVLRSDGNVGVGTNAPATKLQVAGNLNLETSGGDVGLWLHRTDAREYRLYVDSNGLLNLRDQDAGATRMAFKTDGNLGIATTTPGAKLHVNGDAIFENNGSNINIKNTWSSGNHDINFIGGSSTGGSANNTAARIRCLATAPGGAATGSLTFTVNSGDTFVDALYIKEDGNIGIGTNAPNAALTVADSTPHQAIFKTAQTTSSERAGGGFSSLGHATATSRYARLFLDADGANFSGTDYFTIEKFGNSGEVKFLQYSNSNMSFWVNTSTQAMTIKNDGNIGIGIASPSRKLHIKGSGVQRILVESTDNQAGIALRSDSTNDAIIYSPNGTDDLRFYLSAADRVYFKSDGKVGIGTATPATSLHIAAQAPRIRLEDTLDTSNYSMIYADNGQVIISADEGSAQAGSALILKVDNNEVMRMNGANVGIGTNSPARKLHVSGGSGSRSDVQVTYDALGTSANDGAQFGIQSGGAYIWNYENSSIYFGTNNGERMRIMTDGKVGIGTAAPAAKLHVEGDFKVGTTNNGNWMGYKDVSLNGNTYTTALTINLNNHTGCYVKLFLSGDWSSHSAVAFVGEYFIQNGSDGYAEPGTVISEFDNTNTDSIESKIIDPSSDTFTIQLKLSTAANGTLGGKLSYHVMGMATAVS